MSNNQGQPSGLFQGNTTPTGTLFGSSTAGGSTNMFGKNGTSGISAGMFAQTT